MIKSDNVNSDLILTLSILSIVLLPSVAVSRPAGDFGNTPPVKGDRLEGAWLMEGISLPYIFLSAKPQTGIMWDREIWLSGQGVMIFGVFHQPGFLIHLPRSASLKLELFISTLCPHLFSPSCGNKFRGTRDLFP